MNAAPAAHGRTPTIATGLGIRAASLRRGVATSAFGWFGGSRASSASASPKADASEMPPADLGGPGVLGLGDRADHSWTRELTPDPETAKHAPNRSSREVRSGHFVRVLPTPLKKPRVALYSDEMLANLGMSPEDARSERFARFFSGDQGVVPNMDSWATPYALSIMGQRQTGNCPFGNGNGYGDGRAVSIGEVIGTRDGKKQRWEMQLKGGGPTPFCRGADGRAVLRSSIREFLASEAMHALGVETTRALSLVVSEGGDAVNRPWYRPEEQGGRPRPPKITVDDPRLARFPPEVREQIIRQAAREGRDPDVMIRERCAITTRVAPSFARVGHVDLFSRRAERDGPGTQAHRELVQIVRHCAKREFPELDDAAFDADEAKAAAAFLRRSARGIAAMVGGWLRVGFCQGNFNADNCLIGGRTMDYGPFGWMDAYDPYFAKWVGSGEHFAFANQPDAGRANFMVLAASVAPMLEGREKEARAIVAEAQVMFADAETDAHRRKLGLPSEGPNAAEAVVVKLWDEGVEPLMATTPGGVDYVLLFRFLADVAQLNDGDGEALFAPIAEAFYETPREETRSRWIEWLGEWREIAREADDANGEKLAARLKRENPKYVLREWMLAEAYTAAAEGDFSIVEELFELTKAPYDEGAETLAEKYFRRVPTDALDKGGVAFMS